MARQTSKKKPVPEAHAAPPPVLRCGKDEEPLTESEYSELRDYLQRRRARPVAASLADRLALDLADKMAEELLQDVGLEVRYLTPRTRGFLLADLKFLHELIVERRGGYFSDKFPDESPLFAAIRGLLDLPAPAAPESRAA